MAATKPKATRKKAATSKAVAGKKPAARKKAPRKKQAASKTRTASRKPRTQAAAAQAAPIRKQHPLMQTLYAEHRHIASVMQLLREQLTAIEAGELVDTHVVYETMDYMVSWPDRYHHPREDMIYGRAAELDSSVADDVDSLQRDHDGMAQAGRQLLHTIEDWREGSLSGAEVVRQGRAYIDHMFNHMNSEEQLVFPQIQALLSADDWRELAEDDHLRPVTDPVFGRRVQRDYRNLARKLRRGVRRSVERGTLVEWLSVEAVMESMDVLSMAYDSARDTTDDHVRAAWEDGVELFRESALTAPWRLAANNTRLGWRLLQEVAEISRDALDDLARVNRERKDRIRLLDS